MEKYGFIVLHYKLIEITKRCVDSIIESCKSNIEIVIVDNASRDGSGEVLEKIFSDYKFVKVIVLHESTGFSYGNNIGYKFLKENKNCKFIIACNNDLIFEQNDLLTVIERIYKNEMFDVLGPDIRNIDGGHQSPLMLRGRSSEQIINYINYCKNVIKRAKYIALKKKISKKLRLVYSIYKKIVTPKSNIDYLRDYNDPALCGACMIFSEKYISSHENLLSPEVPFYHEEEILWYELKKRNGKIIYRPELYVVHDHSKATNAINTSELEHTVFEMSNTIKSGEVLYNIVKDYERTHRK